MSTDFTYELVVEFKSKNLKTEVFISPLKNTTYSDDRHFFI